MIERKNTKFITYGAKCINNEILMFLEKLKKDKNTKSLDEDPKEENFKPLSIADNKTHIEQDYERKRTNQRSFIINRFITGKDKLLF